MSAFDMAFSIWPRLMLVFAFCMDSFRFVSIPTKLFLLSLFLILSKILSAQLPPNFNEEEVVSGLNSPLDMAFLPDDRALILLQNGEVMITDDAQPATPPISLSPYMKIPDVLNDQERGSTNIILDPQFASNHYFYIFYADSVGKYFRLSRFEALATPAQRLASELLIWQDTDTISACCHFGGAMGFLSDGTLLLTYGDRFDVTSSQDLTRVGGKILRLYTDAYLHYPSDNPFFDGSPGRYNSSGQLQSIYAYGLRNPFTAYMDTSTDRFYIGEVGGKLNGGWEDVHLAEMGANYGWPFCGDGNFLPNNGRDGDGNCINAAYVDPIYSYPHNGNSTSIMMGYINTGTQFPTNTYDGVLFYGEFRQEWIKYFTLDNDGLITSSNTLLSSGATEIVNMQQGPDGSMYYVQLDGKIKRIYWSGAIAPEVNSAAVAYSSTTFTADFSASFTDVGGDALTYEWFYGDGTSSGPMAIPSGSFPLSLPVQSHTYAGKGEYHAYLQLQGSNHTINSESIRTVFGDEPVPVITMLNYPGLFQAGMKLKFDGSASSDADGSLSGSDMTWSIDFINSGAEQPRFGPVSGLVDSFYVPTANHLDFSGGKTYVLTLSITDSDGITASTSLELFPEMVNSTFTSTPAGLSVLIDGYPRSTPFVFDNLVGFQQSIRMVSPICVNGNRYEFSSWDIGGSNLQTYTMPATDETVTATMALTGSDDILSFDGVDDLIGLPALSFSGEFTLEAWVYLDSAGLESNAIFGDGTAYALSFTDSLLRLQAFDGTAGTGYPDPTDKIVGTTLIPDSTWTHIAITRSASGTLILYLNGLVNASASSWTGTLGIDRIGQSLTGFLKGSVDELRLWNVARTENEISSSYEHNVPNNSPGLVAYYRFNDEVGQLINDASINGNDATLGLTSASESSDPARNTTAAPPLNEIPCEETSFPVELLSFTAALQESKVLTQWETVSEEAANFFEVQRKTALDEDFRGLDRIPATGVSSRIQAYQWPDFRPEVGINTYRLKMVDLDGSFTYSPQVEVFIDVSMAFEMYPNPASQTLALSWRGQRDEIASFFLYNTTGQLLKQEALDLFNQNSVSLDVSALPVGVYFYTIELESGIESGKLHVAR